MDMKPSISIIIRTKNEERFIGQTLKMVFDQEINLSFEVIIIDSGSTDRTLEIASQFNIRLFEIVPESFTYGYALNYGVAQARGEYIINLSHDCVPVDREWMKNLISPLVSEQEVAAVLGRQEPVKGLNPFEEQGFVAHFRAAEEGRPRDVFSNANCAIRKKVLEEFPFDEKASFAEDYIWAQILPSDLKVAYVSAASVYHSHPLSFSYWSKRSFNYGLFVPYLKYVYGLKWHAHDISITQAQDSVVRKFLREFVVFKAECMYRLVFLVSNRYFRHILLLPFFVISQRYYYNKGVKEGIKRYVGL